MIEFRESLEDWPQNLDESIELLKSFWCPVEIVEKDGVWELWDGDQLTLWADSCAEIEIFVIGMANGFASIPPEVSNDVKINLGPN